MAAQRRVSGEQWFGAPAARRPIWADHCWRCAGSTPVGATGLPQPGSRPTGAPGPRRSIEASSPLPSRADPSRALPCQELVPCRSPLRDLPDSLRRRPCQRSALIRLDSVWPRRGPRDRSCGCVDRVNSRGSHPCGLRSRGPQRQPAASNGQQRPGYGQHEYCCMHRSHRRATNEQPEGHR